MPSSTELLALLWRLSCSHVLTRKKPDPILILKWLLLDRQVWTPLPFSHCQSMSAQWTQSATFLLHHLFPLCSFLTPHRGRNWGWWCITAAVWLWTSTESSHFTGSSMRGTTSPPSGRRELQPSTGGMTPWSYNSTPPRPLLMCLWGTTLLCCRI